MRMVPEIIRPCSPAAGPQEKAGYIAEKRIYELLQQVEWNHGVAIHRRHLRVGHPKKITGEADFVLILPEGIFVLEVKGSRRLNYDPDSDTWSDGARELRESPIDQAEGNSRAIREFIEKKDISPLPLCSWGVVLVNASVPQAPSGIDLPIEAIMGADEVNDGVEGMEAWLHRLVAWQRKHCAETVFSPPIIEASVLRMIECALAPSWDFRPSLGSLTHAGNEEIHAVTEQQYDLLHFRADQKRSIIEGGAGTGKTFLALELARQKASAGLRVFLVVRSPGLARFLKFRAPAGVEVFDYEKISRDLRSEAIDPADFLVVDEGQDLLQEASIECLDGAVLEGLDKGSWWWFMDSNNQAGISGSLDETMYDYLKNCAVAEPFTLEKNCRNTRQIVEHNRKLLGADLGQPLSEFRGKNPEVRELESADEGRLGDVAREVFLELLSPAEHLEKKQVTVVVVGDPALMERITAEWARNERRHLRRFSIADLRDWPPEGKSLYMTSAEIKGLENDHVVVVVDPAVISWDEDVLLSNMYVALTRARNGLYLIITGSVMHRIRESVEAMFR